uniref:Spaetzle domain-containing protein n=1 Tax=Anopheles quadriannulatus TaxID=34691 RepID=A0A182WTE8_ANOQN
MMAFHSDRVPSWQTTRGLLGWCIISTMLLLLLLVPIVSTAESYGYDSASSCDPTRASRRGRSQLLKTIPCDLSVQAYCNLPGSAYPWHAVRRFVHENQGLMRRMYGDVRHISVLKEEFENNEIDIDDIDRATERYTRPSGHVGSAGGRDGKRMKYLRPSSPHYDGGPGHYPRDKSNEIPLNEPHFRPTQTKTTVTTTTTTTPSSTKLETNESLQATFASGDKDVEETVVKISSTLKLASSSAPEKVDDRKEPLNSVTESGAKAGEIESTIGSYPNDRQDTEEAVSDDIAADDHDSLSSSSKTVAESLIQHQPIQTTSNVQQQQQQQQKIRFESIKPHSGTATGSSTSVKKTSNPEGQLFQDAAQKEPPVVNGRGVNACPVKEEVVAPFWANNTRGEVLALLNLYPFEQYVHWEKCTHELKQMYCREGCRCEQQYRLHRLLAYDPHNECRGIFSDWFRFPSCCICKCYDMPFDFRVTSRSPRSLTKESIELVEDELQNAIYEHAADEWYRPKEHDVE